jgi:hypothetical protein
VVDDEPVPYDKQTEDIGLTSVHMIKSDTEIETETEQSTPHPPSSQHPFARSRDTHFRPYDPGERIPISTYDVNYQDNVQKGYIGEGPCQPYSHVFPTIKNYDKNLSLQLCLLWTIQMARI